MPVDSRFGDLYGDSTCLGTMAPHKEKLSKNFLLSARLMVEILE